MSRHPERNESGFCCGICQHTTREDEYASHAPMSRKVYCASCVNFKLMGPFVRRQSVEYTNQEARHTIDTILHQSLDPERGLLRNYVENAADFTINSIYSNSSDEYEDEDSGGYVSVDFQAKGAGATNSLGKTFNKSVPRPREAAVASLSAQLLAIETMNTKRRVRRLQRATKALAERNTRTRESIKAAEATLSTRKTQLEDLQGALTGARETERERFMEAMKEATPKLPETLKLVDSLMIRTCISLNQLFFPGLASRTAEIQLTRIVNILDFKFTRLEEINLFLEKLVLWQVMLAKITARDLPFWEVASFLPTRDFYNSLGGSYFPDLRSQTPQEPQTAPLALSINPFPTIRLTNVISAPTRSVSFLGASFSESSMVLDKARHGQTSIPLSSTSINNRRRLSVNKETTENGPKPLMSPPPKHRLREGLSIYKILPAPVVKLDKDALANFCLKLSMIIINIWELYRLFLDRAQGSEPTITEIVAKLDEVILDVAALSQDPCSSRLFKPRKKDVGVDGDEFRFDRTLNVEMVTLNSVARFVFKYLERQ
ncbi:hypothetical protein BABINDRAFT_161355 [Babjeviella inositovora NRRL Y-12698]|uniref:Uncharacterized protein n=1 Tax=Babjeviella inositovora NRRL Y-12698 TaxID=984486 RepID=A0A1E3QRW9_9ASCO|nr:uncharacterized protein BABINDRAFT_161355 [Babjeviella inositovora NRRL Y-12698]ODQ80410.1 hypothetical protein BABINDRAFT_161355 [Babjeviella inositovora NRRL Y-12698]